MSTNLMLRIAAAAAAFTLPILAGFATPQAAAGALDLTAQPETAPAETALQAATRQPLILEDTPVTVSGVLPMLSVQQEHDNLGVDFLVQEVEAAPHTVVVGAGVLVKVHPGA